jgi:phage terminase small subunit
MARLNDSRQEEFVRNLARGMNKRSAAIKAGYSQQSAGSIGYQISKRPRVKQRLTELQAAITRTFEILDENELVRLNREFPRFGPHDCRPAAGV